MSAHSITSSAATCTVMFISEGADFLAVDIDYTDQSALLEHRYAECGPIAPEFNARNHIRIAFNYRIVPP
jgi:hypothetical protein